MKKTKTIILILAIVIAAAFALKFTTTVSEVNRQIDEILKIAVAADDTFSADEAKRVNEIISYLKKVDSSIWGFMVNDEVQKLPSSDGLPDQYLVQYRSVE